MALSFVQYTGDGANKVFNVTFQYLQAANVFVKVDDVAVTFTWLDSGRVELTNAPSTGAFVELRRTSDRTARVVDFQDGAVLTEAALDADSNQLFELTQEAFDASDSTIPLAFDGTYDTNNKRIKNIADPVSAQDAVTKSWAESGMTSQLTIATAKAVIATTKASEASASEIAAQSSEDDAAISENNALDYKNAAATSATLSEDWASKTDGPVSGGNYSAKHYASSGNLATVAGAITNVNFVGANIANVNATGTYITNVGIAAANIANINKVAAVDTSVTTVAGIDAAVTSVAGNATDISTNATNIVAIQGASGNASTATSKASEASSSASSASDSEGNASDSEGFALGYKDEAALSATAASDSEGFAEDYKDAAALSASNTATIATAFGDVNGAITTASGHADAAALSATAAADSLATINIPLVVMATAFTNSQTRYISAIAFQ